MKSLSNKAGVVLSVALTGSVAVNLMALQDASPGRTGALERQRGSTETALLNPSAGMMPSATPVVLNMAGPAAQPNGADVIRGVQRELNARNYAAGQPDGVAGLVTRAAVMAYEHDYNLVLTATPSEDLLSRIVLGSSGPQSPQRAGARPTAEAESLIRMVKQHLAALGYQPGRIDGLLAPEAERAIREFETDQKLAETGRISGPLMSRLLRLQGQQAPAKVQPAKNPGAKGSVAKVPANKPPAGKVAPERSAQR